LKLKENVKEEEKEREKTLKQISSKREKCTDEQRLTFRARVKVEENGGERQY